MERWNGKKKQRQNVCVCLYFCVLAGLFIACDLVHAVLSSVAAEKQYCYLMKLLPIKMILCTNQLFCCLVITPQLLLFDFFFVLSVSN